MTVCIAAIHDKSPDEPGIIIACDRKISFFGGTISAEGVAFKATPIREDWTLMFAGDVSPLVPAIEALGEAVKNCPVQNVREFARVCSRAYRKERKQIIENDVLHDHDIETFDEYMSLKQSHEQLFDVLTKKIEDVEQNWNLLLCGFDEQHRPHVFVISERGKIQYCDITGFASIGSGAYAAYTSLSAFPYNRMDDFGSAMYAVLAAKFAADETAEGVGKETLLSALRPGRDAFSFMPEEVIDYIRLKRSDLPKIPKGAAEQLEKDWEVAEKLYKMYQREQAKIKR